MALSDREKRVVLGGGGVLAVGLLLIYVISPLLGEWAASRREYQVKRRSFLEARKEMKARQRLDSSLRALEEKLSVSVPDLPPGEQKQEFVKKVADLGKQSGVMIKSLNPRTRSSRSGVGAAGGRVVYNIQFDAGHASLVNFLSGLKTIGLPVAIHSIDIKSKPKALDQLNVSMEFHTYIFKEG
jgi:Tfp pilus assembly protein PilO